MNKFRFQLACDSFKYTRQRKSGWRNFLSVTVAIFLALILALLVATIVGNNPFEIFRQLFTQGFVNPNQLIVNISILGVSAIAFSFAFKAKLFNIGVSGQMLGAGITALSICTLIKNANVAGINALPAGSLAIVMLLIAIISGGAIAAIIGTLKAYLKVNEVISTIMINWIIFFVVRYAIVNIDYLKPADNNGVITNSVEFAPAFAMNQVGSSTEYGWIAALILLLLSAAIMFFIFKFTTFGLKIKAVGLNESAARYAGFNTKAILVATFTISGVFAGVLAAITYGCRQFAFIPSSIISDTLPTEGLDGIAIGLIGLTNPIGILPVAFLLGMFQSAAPFLSVPSTFSSLITGFIMLGASVYVVFANFKPWIWIYERIHGINSIGSYQAYINENESNISVAKSKLTTIKKYKKIIKKIDHIVSMTNGMKTFSLSTFEGLSIPNFNGSLAEARNYLAKQIEVMENEVIQSYQDEKQRIRTELKKHQIISECSTYFYPNLVIKANMKHYDKVVESQLSKANGRLATKYNKLEDALNNVENNPNKAESLMIKMENIKAKMATNVSVVNTWKEEHLAVTTKRQNKKAYNLGNLAFAYYHNLEKAKLLDLNPTDKQNLIDWLSQGYSLALGQIDEKYVERFNKMQAQQAQQEAETNLIVLQSQLVVESSKGAY